ncbi:hypothetical protein AURDEDRAFT_140663 [Auricularia subglabra TFB-10046 SS5]|uniref:Uncharacterized protein n=1 Tax=Auricularia subglabra (strain TFB-10046 / SS5) TaxID=717982 RepID=J0WKR2_AURST|nr:hypothetical protein AURDEDRAFT_140695 [Auricularia subglabra TFB-10046 SS5]EJD33075.1 hypothetical protein AURDEDRAFT_140663 [Auricularia subglabra TFB-10046 SS5]
MPEDSIHTHRRAPEAVRCPEVQTAISLTSPVSSARSCCDFSLSLQVVPTCLYLSFSPS